MKRLATLVLLFNGLAFGQVTIATESYNNARTSLNASETVLTTANVNQSTFGKLTTLTVDGEVYAQPLYIAGSPDLLIIGTMNDTVYAFNADTISNTPVWTANLKPGGAAAVPASMVSDGDFDSTIGVLSTPVYDSSTGTIYAVSFTLESSSLIYRLHALASSNGAEKFSGPVVLSLPVGTENLQRAGLGLANSQVYIAWASFSDIQPYDGLIGAYSASTLAQNGSFKVVPTLEAGGIWQSGAGPAIDGSGSVYYVTGNGDTGDCNYGVTFGQSVLRFTSASGLTLGDWFTTSNCASYDMADYDLGSGGPVLFGSVVIEVGKDSVLRVLSTASLGHESAGDSQIVQSFSVPSKMFSKPAYFNSTLYLWPVNNYLAAYSFNGSTFNTTPSLGNINQGSPKNPGIAISANGTSNGILWAYSGSGPADYTGKLWAIDAGTLTTKLWDSSQNSSRDAVGGNWSKFSKPVVDNGRVFVGTNASTVVVYGLLTAGVTTISGATLSGAVIQ